jgi:hypothetical protein
VSYSANAWRIECPEHGWHGAVEFAAKGTMPAVVKCTAAVGRGRCDVKVPLEQALELAGLDANG